MPALNLVRARAEPLAFIGHERLVPAGGAIVTIWTHWIAFLATTACFTIGAGAA